MNDMGLGVLHPLSDRTMPDAFLILLLLFACSSK